MIPAGFTRALAGLVPVLERLEPRHWVAVAGSVVLHLAMLLGLSQAPPPAPVLTFEVKLEPPPEEKLPRQRVTRVVKAKALLAMKKPAKKRVRAPDTLEAQWQGDVAKDAPAVSLPAAHAVATTVDSPATVVGKLARTASRTPASTQKPAPAGSALSEPGSASASAGGASDSPLTASPQPGQALSVSSAGARSGEAPGSSAATGSVAAGFSGATPGAMAPGGARGGDFSAQNSAALASGEPGGVRLSLSSALSGLVARLASPGGGPAGTQLSGASGDSAAAAAAAAGPDATLASAASGGPQVGVATATRGDAAAAETAVASEHGATAHGDAARSDLASAVPSGVAPGGKAGTGQLAGPGENGGVGAGAAGTPGSGRLADARPDQAAAPRGHGLAEAGRAAATTLAGKGAASGEGHLVTANGQAAALPGQAPLGSGFGRDQGAAAALAPGEPGSVAPLALAMPVVPAVLELRMGGTRSSPRTQGGEARGASTQATVLGQSGVAAQTLPGRGAESPAYSSSARPASLAGSDAGARVAGRLGSGKVVAAVGQIRPDSQVRPLDVLAPSTYCPLPGHVQPDNRPRDTVQNLSEKPAYASDNPSFVFPLRAWAYGHQGRVTVRVQILADGVPGQMLVKQSSGSAILDADAREQLARYHFKPARKSGQPVAFWIDVPVDYRLNAEKSP